MGGSQSKERREEERLRARGLMLVPPLFERDFRGRSRMTGSSYDWMFCKPGLKWLFNDYVRGDSGLSIVRLRPSEDPRLTVHTRLAAKNISQDLETIGRMALRFQPVVEEPLTFVDIKAGTQGAGAIARACYFDTERGFGAFASLPLIRQNAAGYSPDVSLGLRYSSPSASVGVIGQPLSQQVRKAWAVGRSGAFCAGVQVVPGFFPTNKKQLSVGEFIDMAPQCTSYAISYSPDAAVSGRGRFTTAVELKEASQLTLSLLYHMAAQRRVKNPLEEDNIVGITNYLDMGLQISSSLVEDGVAGQKAAAGQESNLRLAAAWQINKNWLLKARVGSDAIAAIVALKAWWQPSMTFGLSAVYDFASRLPRFGLTFNVENYGNIRYERSEGGIRMGRALVQRHVALSSDVANKQGEGLLVKAKDLQNKQILGQTQAHSANYL